MGHGGPWRQRGGVTSNTIWGLHQAQNRESIKKTPGGKKSYKGGGEGVG